MSIENIELITNIFAVLLVCQIVLIAIFTLMKNKIDKLGKIIFWMIWLSVVTMCLYIFSFTVEDFHTKLGIKYSLILISMSSLNLFFTHFQKKRAKGIEKNE